MLVRSSQHLVKQACEHEPLEGEPEAVLPGRELGEPGDPPVHLTRRRDTPLGVAQAIEQALCRLRRLPCLSGRPVRRLLRLAAARRLRLERVEVRRAPARGGRVRRLRGLARGGQAFAEVGDLALEGLDLLGRSSRVAPGVEVGEARAAAGREEGLSGRLRLRGRAVPTRYGFGEVAPRTLDRLGRGGVLGAIPVEAFAKRFGQAVR